MKYIFFSHYIALLLKGKYRWIQVLVALALVWLPFTDISRGLLNFLFGKPLTPEEIISPFVFVYLIINSAYAGFNKVEIELQVKNKTKEKPIENEKSTTISKEPQNKKNPILSNKNYAKDQVVKKSPTVQTSPPKSGLTEKKTETAKSIQTEAPDLEPNFESAPEFNENKSKELTKEYSGVVDENFVPDQEGEDEIIVETPIADPSKALFHTIQGKNFFTK
jgi:hypothetical protein